jgi:hypothetical protein
MAFAALSVSSHRHTHTGPPLEIAAMRVFVVFVLLLSGLSLLAFGAAISYAPLQVMAMADVVTRGAAATVELRAFYGGLEIALGVLVLICAWRPERRRDGLWLTLFVYAGIGITRGLGMLIDDVYTGFLGIALVVELGIAVMAAVALWVWERREPRILTLPQR